MKTTSYFTHSDSIVRTIWGKSDTVLLIFGGAAAEFALNEAVDWLYYTGKLPADPLGRMFSTVDYARQIIFSTTDDANRSIDIIRSIHEGVEVSRGAQIPDWAYRDVLYMLIYYSVASFELLERPLTVAEKDDIYDVFHRTGLRMQLKGLPPTYTEWLISRDHHLDHDLVYSKYTADLFNQYLKHLGKIRYWTLLESQKLIVPERVRELLGFGKISMLKPVFPAYKLSRRISLDRLFKTLLLPDEYKKQIDAIDSYAD